MALLDVERLTVAYGRTRAVRDVSFDLGDGEIVGLLGESDSGKTTLGNAILRLLSSHGRITGGAIRFDGRPVANYQGLHGSELRAKVEELLETVGLSPASTYLGKFPHELSGGQQQRIVVARALAPDPEVIVADEPVSMLDVSIRAEILQLLDELVRSRGIAMLYITHDLLIARMLADEVLVVHQGKLVESGSTLQVIRDAQHEYTRDLLDAVPNPFTSPAS